LYGGFEGTLSQGILDSLESDAKQYLERIANQLRQDGIETGTHFSFLPAGTEIVERAEKEQGTLIVMGTHGRSGFRRALLGSVTDRVIRSSAAPVLVIRGDPAAQ
jgi:nucleotide-binding universal stress UspA family protein